MYSLSFLCLSWRLAPPTTSKMKESGCSFKWKRNRKSSKWDRCPEKLCTNARRWKCEQRNWGSSDEVGSCSSAGAQRRKTNKKTPIPVPNKEQKKWFRLYSYTDDLHPRQDAIGWRISPSTEHPKLGIPSRHRNTYLAPTPPRGLAPQSCPCSYSTFWGPSENLQSASRACNG